MWDQWSKNVEQYMMSTHIEVQFLPAVQLLSLPSMSHYIDFITEMFVKYKKPIRLNWASVSWPTEFNLEVIPLEVLPYIDQCLTSLDLLYYMSESHNQKQSIEYFIKSLKLVRELGVNQNQYMLDDKNWCLNFKKFFDKLDDRRGTTWWETFPEFAMIKEITNV
jgi:hypothetical protein